jgi:2-polyprenyl-3-methyl-5-hydroxy-6-metoxy-1,4-benzoquinol methylase
MEQVCEQALEAQTSSATVAYFNAVAAAWNLRYTESRHFQERLQKVLAWVAAYPPQTPILDFGCGSGVLLKALSAANFKLTGVDISPRMIDEARRNLATVPQNERARLFQVGPDFEGPHTDQLYEGIFCLGVLEYLEDPHALLEHLCGLLKPGGFLMLSFPNQESCLRGVEEWVHRNAKFFRPFGILPHITGKDNYLQFQRHQFTLTEMTDDLKPYDMTLKRTHYHVAPGFMQGMANGPGVGMSVITEWIKAHPDPYPDR